MKNAKKILIFNDLDGTLFRSEQFIEYILKSVGKQKSDILSKKIQDSREKTGSSATVPVMNIVGSEAEAIDGEVRRKDYIYDDVEEYMKNTEYSDFEIKHIILTHGNKSLQEYKIRQSFLENLPIEIRAQNDKVSFIKSTLTVDNKYNYNGYIADVCFLVDDKIASFEESNNFSTAKNIPNFKGFLIKRQNEYNHNDNKNIPDFINQISSLSQVLEYISGMQVD